MERGLLPLGHEDFVQAELEWVAMTHQVLLDRIPGIPDVQAALLLLLHTAQATANCMSRACAVANECVSLHPDDS